MRFCIFGSGMKNPQREKNAALVFPFACRFCRGLETFSHTPMGVHDRKKKDIFVRPRSVSSPTLFFSAACLCVGAMQTRVWTTYSCPSTRPLDRVGPICPSRWPKSANSITIALLLNDFFYFFSMWNRKRQHHRQRQCGRISIAFFFLLTGRLSFPNRRPMDRSVADARTREAKRSSHKTHHRRESSAAALPQRKDVCPFLEREPAPLGNTSERRGKKKKKVRSTRRKKKAWPPWTP